MFGKSLTTTLLIGGACFQFATAEEISLVPAPQQAISQIAFLQNPKDSGSDVLKPQRVDGPSPRPVPSAEFDLPNIGNQQPFTPPTPPSNFQLNGMNSPSTQRPAASNTAPPGVFWIEHLDGGPFGTTPFTSFGTNQFLFLDDETSLMVQGSGRISNNGEGGMRGLDFDVAVNLNDNGLEGFLGYYHFSGEIGGSTDGIKGGMVITVTHADSAAGIGNGTGVAGDPFGSLTQADVSMNDIVYVHADSVFNNQSFAIADGQRLLGEGDGQVHFVQTDQLDMIPLPAGNGGVNRPVLTSSPNGIALGSDTELSNFQFNADVGMPPLSSISASGINGIAFVNRVGIDGGLAGIILDTSPAGGVVLSEIQIQNSIQRGIVAAGVGGLAIDNTMIILGDNNAVGIEYINAGGLFGVDNTFIDMNNAAMTIGIRVENNSAVDPLELFGMNNFVNQAANASQSQDFGGGFNGMIEINGGGNDLP